MDCECEICPVVDEKHEAIDVLSEVMSWINNWSPSFIEDDEWAETEARVKKVLG